MNKSIKIIVTGLVQGIGYRPFILRIANKYGINGSVKNTNGIVEILACGDADAITGFLGVVKKDVPEGGRLDGVSVEELSDVSGDTFSEGFSIIDSTTTSEKVWPVIPADLATCEECERELWDKNNRRYGHPFISCVKCGPRYTVTEQLPYDRKRLVLKKFSLCPECAKEYTDAVDRRCFAQTISCKSCGPKLNRPVEDAIDDVKAGKILAVKDIGGYHLACLPRKDVIQKIRDLKNRPSKPFAVMFESISEIEKYAYLDDKEKQLLTSPARPIVLLKLRDVHTAIDGSTSPYLGAMLPCNPVQIMLIKACGPLIMTSANTSGGLMITDNDMMISWLKDRVEMGRISEEDYSILSHDRDIIVPLDDSIVRVVRNRVLMVRRARGYAPMPITADVHNLGFAAGGDLKATFSFSVPGTVYMGPTLSDLEDERCATVYQDEVARMVELFGFEPSAVAVDKHPLYKSVNIAKNIFSTPEIHNSKNVDKMPTHSFQHHKAHVASVVAEHALNGDVLGFAFDGTGYGDDGSIWGSEVFVVRDNVFERVTHLPELSLMASDEASKNCKAAAIALAICVEKNDEDSINNSVWVDRFKDYIRTITIDKKTLPFIEAEYQLTEAAIANNLNRVKSTSAGRYFDAVSSLLGLCQYNTYEGEAAQELEYAAVKGNEKALEFHRLIADFIINMAEKIGIQQVALSGGTFLNRVLLEMVIDGLEEKGFKVYINEQVSCGDGGIALGQLYLLDKNCEV